MSMKSSLPLSEFGDDAKILAGGQSLLPLLNFRLANPRYLIDVNRLADLDYVRPLNGGLTIGAMDAPAHDRAICADP